MTDDYAHRLERKMAAKQADAERAAFRAGLSAATGVQLRRVAAGLPLADEADLTEDEVDEITEAMLAGRLRVTMPDLIEGTRSLFAEGESMFDRLRADPNLTADDRAALDKAEESMRAAAATIDQIEDLLE